MSRLFKWLVITALLVVIADFALIEYSNYRQLLQTQTYTVKSAVAQINEIAQDKFTRNLARIAYKQGELDTFIKFQLGAGPARKFKQHERGYLSRCIPQYGELECRRAWYTALLVQLSEIMSQKAEDPVLIPT